MKFIAILVAVLLTSCAHRESIDEQVNEIKYDLMVNQINQLRESTRRLDYYIAHERCFAMYGICLGEDKKDHKACWASHDACVIRVYKQWMRIK